MFNPDWGIQANLREQGITYPSVAVIKAALDRYQTHYRKPVDAYYCLDGSGSMNDNAGWAGVRDAAHQIFDADQAALNLLQTHPEDITTVTVFNSGIAAGPWRVTGNDPGQLHGLTEKIVAHEPGSGTNMYACLKQAVLSLNASKSAARKSLVIVMSDGMSEDAEQAEAVAALKAAGVPVVAIAFGDDADPGQLKQVAEATGGAFVQQTDLVAALRTAAGYK